jgi:hypothetical protein
MSDIAQKRAVRDYRSRLSKGGLARFEVLGLKADRDLIRAFARHLTEAEPDATSIRDAVNQLMPAPRQRKGRILDALRRSPFAHIDRAYKRTRTSGRKIDL